MKKNQIVRLQLMTLLARFKCLVDLKQPCAVAVVVDYRLEALAMSARFLDLGPQVIVGRRVKLHILLVNREVDLLVDEDSAVFHEIKPALRLLVLNKQCFLNIYRVPLL
jgi:hypothetical protein